MFSGRFYHTQSGLTVCGGYRKATCTQFNGGQWSQVHKMPNVRGSHSSWMKPNGEIVLLGGYEDETLGIKHNTTEIVNGITQEPFNLKYSVRYNLYLTNNKVTN